MLKETTSIYFESSDQHFSKYGYDSNDVFEFLANHGFMIFKIRASEKSITLIPEGYTSRQRINLLALRQPDNFLARTGYTLKDQVAST